MAEAAPQLPDGLPAAEENVIKIILLGDSAVGKSKLVERFLMNEYQPRQLSTFALTLFRHVGVVGGKQYQAHQTATAPHLVWGGAAHTHRWRRLDGRWTFGTRRGRSDSTRCIRPTTTWRTLA
mmetsp:Transcript_17772/g.58435  ORF Transcript_17772/g.58435 Transcript_17772/m.58435 type:complete len:123 (+) Transcript_17772:106-474(+)